MKILNSCGRSFAKNGSGRQVYEVDEFLGKGGTIHEIAGSLNHKIPTPPD
jgi:hypothetical protein